MGGGGIEQNRKKRGKTHGHKQQCWQGYGEKSTFLHCWCECSLVQPLWKAVWRHLKKLRMDLPFDPETPLLEVYLREPKILIRKNITSPMLIAVLFTITKIWKQPKCPPVDKWIKQLWYVYLHNRKLLGSKNRRKFYPLQQHGWTWRTLC